MFFGFKAVFFIKFYFIMAHLLLLLHSSLVSPHRPPLAHNNNNSYHFHIPQNLSSPKLNNKCFPTLKTIDPTTTTTSSSIQHPSDYFYWKDGIDAKQIHAQLIKSSKSHTWLAVANKLAISYSRLSTSLDYARKLFDEIPHRTISVYAALIRSYCRSQRWVDLISVFALMIHEGFHPDKFMLPTVLKACSALEMLNVGRMIHGFVVRNNLELDVYVGNALVDMYSNSGDLGSSTRAFEMMPGKDVVSWTALVAAYMDAGLMDEAMDVFQSMKLNGVNPDLITWNAMISGFARNGEIGEALHNLQLMQKEAGFKPGVSTWNGIISGCVQNGYFSDALDVIRHMLSSFVKPNAVTLASILPACRALHNLRLGREIHAYAFKHDTFRGNTFVGGSLIDMYSKCGRKDMAQRTFMGIENRNTTIYNEIITTHVNDDDMLAASKLLHQMQTDGLKPDIVTYNVILAGYTREGQKDEAFRLFSEMIQMGLRPNVISLNVLISGFQQSGLGSEALELFRVMQSPSIINDSSCMDGLRIIDHDLSRLLNVNVSIQPNSVTLTSALAACADLDSSHKGRQIHGYILRNAHEDNIYVMGALVDMYAKCHDMHSATEVFYSIRDQNTVAYNILMAGHVNNEEPEEALKLFSKMVEVSLEPSLSTLKILLAACRHIPAAHRLGRELCGYIVKEFISCPLEDMYAQYRGLLQIDQMKF